MVETIQTKNIKQKIRMILFMIILFSSVTLSQNQTLSTMDCLECHNDDAWFPLDETPIFKHNQTLFQLLGQHQYAECNQCHLGETVEEKHQFSFDSIDCSDCHFDIHFESNGSDCDRCHSPISWDTNVSGFNHDLTLFPLAGVHFNLQCQTCHQTESREWTSWIPTECEGCHQNQINAQIQSGLHPDNFDCILCHNTWSWLPIDMSHHDIIFPIYSGEHRNEWTSCNAECHVNPNDYTEFSCGLNGVCHEHSQSEMDDEHDDESGYRYESYACYQCHPNGEKDD